MPFIKDGVAYVPLQKTRKHRRWFALMDVEDYERSINVKWMGILSGRTIYVRATSSKFLASHHMQMHSFVMKVQPGQRVDHENNNGLDCRKVNLRIANGGQNARNSLKTNSTHVTSRFKGVSITSSGRWASSIAFEGDVKVLGLFDDEAEAARAYDEAAVRLFGEFAKTNKDMGLYDHPEPVRDFTGWNVSAGYRFGAEFVSRETLAGEAEGEPWHVMFEGNPERKNFETVVAMARHHRNKTILYRLGNGSCVYPNAYTGPKVPPEEILRMKRELHDREAARRTARLANAAVSD